MKKRKAAFTLVEMVVAMAIFSLILAFVYKTFFSFAQTTKASAEATTKVQRDRIALKTIEDAFSGLVYYEQNQSIYGFVVNTEDYDYPSISFVSRVPPDFLGNKEFGSERLRRITFQVEDDEDYGRSLVMYQSSTLQPMESLEVEEPSRWVLGQDLDTFLMVFWSTINGEWVYEWTETNSIPTRIKFEMAYVRADGSAALAEDMQKREIIIFSESITKNMQNPTLPAAKGGGSRGRGSSRGSSSSRRKPTQAEIDAYRKKMAERNKGRDDGKGRGDSKGRGDGKSRYTDAQKAAYRKKMAERYAQWRKSQGGGRSSGTGSSKSGGSTAGVGTTGGGTAGGGTAGGGTAGGGGALTGNANYIEINDAIMDYAALNDGEVPENVDQLVDDGFLTQVPDPPSGTMWVISPEGILTNQRL